MREVYYTLQIIAFYEIKVRSKVDILATSLYWQPFQFETIHINNVPFKPGYIRYFKNLIFKRVKTKK